MSDTLQPNHIGVIMDGNRRWAAERGKQPIEGHKAGFEALFALIPVIKELQIPYVSIYAFSAENWLRSKTEVAGIVRLLKWVVKNRLQTFKEEDIRIKIVGSRQNLSADLLAALEQAERETSECRGLTLGVCFNYGGQQEIIDAAKRAAEAGAIAILAPETFEQFLYEPDIPKLDFVIRTSGEQRLSNFMLWRAAYAELYFTDKLWPDFTETDLRAALETYANRQRRFGK